MRDFPFAPRAIGIIANRCEPSYWESVFDRGGEGMVWCVGCLLILAALWKGFYPYDVDLCHKSDGMRHMSRHLGYLLFTSIALLTTLPAASAADALDWNYWRGPEFNGISREDAL